MAAHKIVNQFAERCLDSLVRGVHIDDMRSVIKYFRCFGNTAVYMIDRLLTFQNVFSVMKMTYESRSSLNV